MAIEDAIHDDLGNAVVLEGAAAVRVDFKVWDARAADECTLFEWLEFSVTGAV